MAEAQASGGSIPPPPTGAPVRGVLEQGSMDVKNYNFDKALTEREFEAKYGPILALGLWGGLKVGSALTRRYYYTFDYGTGEYVREVR